MSIKQIYKDSGLHIQQLDYSCGPVSLLNLLTLKGRSGHSELELVELCRALPEVGTTNANMVAAAKALGLEVLEATDNAEIDQLEEHLDRSAFVIVCYLCLSGGGHYSLVSEYDRQALYLLDCTHGLLRIEKPNFYDRWQNKSEPTKRWFMAVA